MTFRAAVPPASAFDDAAPLGVQAGLPRSSSSKSGGANSLFVLLLMVAPLLVVVTVFLWLALGL